MPDNAEKADEPGAASPDKAVASPALSDDGGMPRELVFWGIAVGIMLTACGAAMMALLPQVSNLGALMTCVGFGIVLAAFGARAAGTWQSWSIVGSGAMAVMLFLLLELYAPPPPPVPFVYGHLRGTETMQDVAVAAQNSFLAGRLGTGGHWQFFAREEWLTGDIFSVTATPPSGTLPNPIVIGCLKLSLLRERMGSRDGVDLSLVRDDAHPSKQHWVLVSTGQSDPLGVFGNPLCPVQGRSPIKAASLVRRTANLLVAPAAAANAPLDPGAIFKSLNAESLTGQGQAQDVVAGLRERNEIQALVQSWQPSVWNDRLDTGLLIAWVKGIRQTRDIVIPIASAISREQLDHIVELAGNRDRTTRYNAAELLSWLLQSTAWPNPPPPGQIAAIVEAVLKPFADPENYARALGSKQGIDVGNVSYNALVALQDAKCDMRSQDRDHVAAVLSSFEASEYVRRASLARTASMSQQFRAKPCNP
jgi:hypothetical protein